MRLVQECKTPVGSGELSDCSASDGQRAPATTRAGSHMSVTLALLRHVIVLWLKKGVRGGVLRLRTTPRHRQPRLFHQGKWVEVMLHTCYLTGLKRQDNFGGLPWAGLSGVEAASGGNFTVCHISLRMYDAFYCLVGTVVQQPLPLFVLKCSELSRLK